MSRSTYLAQGIAKHVDGIDELAEHLAAEEGDPGSLDRPGGHHPGGHVPRATSGDDARGACLPRAPAPAAGGAALDGSGGVRRDHAGVLGRRCGRQRRSDEGADGAEDGAETTAHDRRCRDRRGDHGADRRRLRRADRACLLTPSRPRGRSTWTTTWSAATSPRAAPATRCAWACRWSTPGVRPSPGGGGRVARRRGRRLLGVRRRLAPPARRARDPTFLRGTQVADAEGIVEFATVYPGWYPGPGGPRPREGAPRTARPCSTSQLYFPEDLTDDDPRRGPVRRPRHPRHPQRRRRRSWATRRPPATWSPRRRRPRHARASSCWRRPATA